MKISLFVSLCCSVVFYSSAIQAACVQPPSCEELGFTVDASKCEGSFLKCPWDLSKAACKETLPILYGDGTVASKILKGKTPIGVVFDKTNKLAVALTDVKKDGTPGSAYIYWSSDYCDTPGLENCDKSKIPYGTISSTPITCGVDGRANTDAILASTCNGTTYAANAANSYEPAGCTKDFCKKTKWFLPSLRDLQNIHRVKDLLETTMTSLSSSHTTIYSHYWSSTAYSDTLIWGASMVGHARDTSTKYLTTTHVRPVLAY